MSTELLGVIGIILLIVLILLRMWIGAAMAMIGFIGYTLIVGIKPAYAVVGQIPYTTIANYSLCTVPLFILMGVILYEADIGKDLYHTMYTCIGQLKGGLAMATVLACALFAAITGVSSPALVTLGKIAIPEMRKYRYYDTLSTGALVSAGTLAFLIPPSVAFIIYGVLTEKSIAKLFMAGVFPGLLLAFLFILVIAIRVAIDPKSGPAGPKTTVKAKVVSLKSSWSAVVLFLFVLGGLYMGWFTPTEAGAIGAFGSLVITIIMRRLTFNKFINSCLESAQNGAFIFLLIMGAYILMKFLAVSNLPTLLADTIVDSHLSKYVVLLFIVILYLILGMFLDIISAFILTIPVIYPLIIGLGFDPYWYGCIVVILIEMGLVTPPVGMDVFVLAGAVNIPMGTIFKGALPFVAAMLLGVLLLTIFPQIATWLPSVMYQ